MASRSLTRRGSDARDPGLAGYLNSEGIRALANYAMRSGIFWLVCASGSVLWLVWLYGSGLRDPRYLDGWMIASAMSLQLYFHISIKTGTMAPKAAMRWRKIHIFLGYLLIAGFLSHTDFSLPDNGFEWALWMGFVLITLSGIFGTYLSWALKAKRKVDERIKFEQIPVRYGELAWEIQTTVNKTDQAAAALALPVAPYDAWIMDLYTSQLREFFLGHRNFIAHLIGSQRPVKRMTDEIDRLSLYVDQQAQDKLAIIRELVVEKDRLDFARVYLGMTKGWLFVHVPVTYTLIVLVPLHVVVVYSFSSGAW
jgi:hypothetical protein